MKTLVLLLTVAFSALAHAGETPHFSAFAVGDDLYVTVLGDTCNDISGSLDVDGICLEGRSTLNMATTCTAAFRYGMTRMACPDRKTVARVVTLSLKNEKVAIEAKVLKLQFQGQEIEVKLDRAPTN